MPVLEILQVQAPEYLVHTRVRLLSAEHVIERSEDHVLVYGGHEHLVIGILQDKAELSSYLRQTAAAHFNSVHQDLPFSLYQPQQQLHDGGFSRPIGSDQPDGLTLPDTEGQILQDWPVLLIGKAHILKFDHLSRHLTIVPPSSSAILTERRRKKAAKQTTIYMASRGRKGLTSA